eukprot:4283408-Amphidinium_carterae.2
MACAAMGPKARFQKWGEGGALMDPIDFPDFSVQRHRKRGGGNSAQAITPQSWKRDPDAVSEFSEGFPYCILTL